MSMNPVVNNKGNSKSIGDTTLKKIEKPQDTKIPIPSISGISKIKSAFNDKYQEELKVLSRLHVHLENNSNIPSKVCRHLLSF